MKYKIMSFRTHGDERGQLVSLEENIDVPFVVKRVYYMYFTEKLAIRGKHAHKTLKQVLICTSGSCKILLDDGNEKQIIELNKPNVGLYIDSAIWREMFDFSSDAVLIVLASDFYKESDYIRNYDDFINYIKGR